MWKDVENILMQNDYQLNDLTYDEIFTKIDRNIKIKSINASYRANNVGVHISYEDFYSYFLEAIWNGLHAFISDRNLILSHVMTHRLKIAELTVWRRNQHTGSNKDKNRITYISTRNLSLDSMELDIKYEMDLYNFSNLKILIEEFSEKYPEDGLIIKMLYHGYSPKLISKKLFNCSDYSDKYRKRINRTRHNFETFYVSK